jgi:tRNA/tmRNA/rRNA uracil-C5-methylase (TrmA/RlmC/RlmD family)
MKTLTAETGIEQVRAALERGERLTPLDALNRFGLWSLASAIHALRKQGMEIDAELIEVASMNSGSARVAQYRIAPANARDD